MSSLFCTSEEVTLISNDHGRSTPAGYSNNNYYNKKNELAYMNIVSRPRSDDRELGNQYRKMSQSNQHNLW